jgi:hypothetical protein
MRWVALAVGLLASTPVEAHCFARWYYPWPQQRCGVARQMVRAERGHNPTRFREVLSPTDIANREHPGNKARLVLLVHGPAVEIALPSLAQADLDGGGADEPTRARLLLRAALEAANGH